MMSVSMKLRAVALTAITTRTRSAQDPVARFRRLFERPPLAMMYELWNRNGYGRHATEMVRDQPAFGVGDP